MLQKEEIQLFLKGLGGDWLLRYQAHGHGLGQQLVQQVLRVVMVKVTVVGWIMDHVIETLTSHRRFSSR